MRFSKVLSFLTLSGISDMLYVEQKFNEVHSKFKSQFSFWSVGATRKKLVVDFWYRQVLTHFVGVFGIAWLATFFSHPFGFSPAYLLAAGSVFLVAFFVMIIWIYLPIFGSDYCPKLESYSEQYSGSQNLNIQKCKKHQFSLKTLVLIQHVLEQLAGIVNQFLDGDRIQVLGRQYGVSVQGLQIATKKIFLSQFRLNGGRILTELENSFEEAYRYFRSLNCIQGEQILKNLELKLRNKNLMKIS